MQFTGMNLLLFLTGAAAGCVLIYWSGASFPLEEWVVTRLSTSELPVMVLRLCIINGKFLVLLYLLSCLRHGAALIPAVFGLEGMLLGSAFGTAFSSMGRIGITTLGMILMFRLLVLLPYGFLLGTWSLDRCLQVRQDQDAFRSGMAVFILTIAVVTGAALLECLVGRSLGRMYYLKIGV